MNSRLKRIIISEDTTIKNAMTILDGSALEGLPPGIVLITDTQNTLKGIVTDGDIRRAIVNKISINANVSDIMIKDPITIDEKTPESEILDTMMDKVSQKVRLRDKKVDHIIIVDKNMRLVDVYSFYELLQRTNYRYRKICIIGMGFVGLTLAVVLADAGFKVVGYDVQNSVVNMISNGAPQFYEKGLSSLLKHHIEKQNLQVVNSFDDVNASAYIIAVGTPIDENKKPILNDIIEATTNVGKKLKKNDGVFLRSTVSVGTTRTIVLPILEKESNLNAGDDFMLAFTPERTVEGNALQELRTIPQPVGGINYRSTEAAANLFSSITNTIVRLPNPEEAEMLKLINNSFRDLSFAFANELSLICNKLKLDTSRVIEAANRGYKRNLISAPSPGVGGVCLRKDPYIYGNAADNAGISTCLPVIGRQINESIPNVIKNKIINFYENNSKIKDDFKILILGFAFKGIPETSDMRGSVTIDLVNLLKNYNGINISGYDPMVKSESIEQLGIEAVDINEGFHGANAILLMNNHKEFRSLEILSLLKKTKKPTLFFDGWRIFPANEIQQIDGVIYDALGSC